MLNTSITPHSSMVSVHSTFAVSFLALCRFICHVYRQSFFHIIRFKSYFIFKVHTFNRNSQNLIFPACAKQKRVKTQQKKISSVGKIICIANNSLEVCLIGLAPSENAIARKFTTVWVDAKQKNSQQKLNELKRQDFAD